MGFLKKHEGWFPYHLCIERFRLEFAQIHLSPPGNCLEIRVKCLICSNHLEVSKRFGMISSLQLPWKLGTANVGTPWGEFSTLRKELEANVFVDMSISYWHNRKKRKQGPAMDLTICCIEKKRTNKNEMFCTCILGICIFAKQNIPWGPLQWCELISRSPTEKSTGRVSLNGTRFKGDQTWC